jgi:3-hydroxyacyl-[acyl-carrier-protein] dehydratase
MRPAPFIAHWRSGPVVAGAFQARLGLDDEALFAGHYPGAPILPGSFLIEALLQAASTALGGDVHLEEIVTCRFHSPLFPGDEVLAAFEIKDTGAGRSLVEVTASGRAPAAALTMVVSPVLDAREDAPGPAPSWDDAARGARILDTRFIRGALPHRPPALLVDSGLVLDLPGRGPALLARKGVTMKEPCYGSISGSSDLRYPPSLIVESFCQACGLLRVSQTPAGEQAQQDRGKVRVVAKLAKMRFFGDAVPGDLIEHRIRIAARTPDGAVFSGQSVVADRVILDVGRVVAAAAKL